MLFGTKQKFANASFKTQLHGSDIERVRNVCYLGVTLDEHLSWKEHVSKVFTKVNKRFGLLGRIRSCLTLEAAKCVYNCLVLPVTCATPTRPGVNGPFAASGHMVQNHRHAGEQAVHWDIQNKATSSRQICIFFVFDVPVRSLLSSARVDYSAYKIELYV